MTEPINWHADEALVPDHDLVEPRSIRRLLKRKEKLSARFQQRERKRGLHGAIRKRTLLRSRLYKIDLRLERAGLFATPLTAPSGASLWTPDGYIAGFAKMPGANSGYRGGRNLLLGGAIHVTVGTNSTAIGMRGYFKILLPKVWPPQMYSEGGAVDWAQCEHNPYLFSVETEKYHWNPEDPQYEETTDDQILGWAYIIAAYREIGVGVPFDYFMCDHCVEPGRYSPHTYFPHNSLRQYACDQHHSYLPAEDMARANRLSFTISGGAPVEEDDMPGTFDIYIIEVGPTQGWLVGDGTGYNWIGGDVLSWFREARKPPYNIPSREIHVQEKTWAHSLVAQAPPRP